MKNLSLISFVGIDIETKLDDLLQFYSNSESTHIIYEFGILYSDSKNGIYKRYPQHDFCNYYLQWSMNKINSSLHLCGNAITRYLNEDKDIIDLCSYAGRIQLNLNMNKYKDHDVLADNILRIVEKNNHSIILQQNNAKKNFNNIYLSKIKNDNKLSLLNDSSGGFGKEIIKVFPPHDKYFTGYAGGIKSSNVLNIVSIIENSNIENKKYYIDMESGVRVNNIFSINECLKIKELIDYQLLVQK